MPKYYCDYCDTYLTHDSPSVRKTHCSGRKHKDSVRDYYQHWLEEQVQKIVDETTAAFKNRSTMRGMSLPPPGMLPPGYRPGMPLPPMGPPPIMVPGVPPPIMRPGVPPPIGLPPGYPPLAPPVGLVPPPVSSGAPPVGGFSAPPPMPPTSLPPAVPSNGRHF